ncbi:hypothetical protein Cgig2_019298 [Carnegiea gigantea]|uniref:Yos1-like protein n=1 Tax=Carnegiea gigantea TaxID=171969 RepID=A0A9Q1KMM4_9CARY|nr:hypothetical protein Cgig2_019298 [Carnegiea gigantea]
MENETQSESVGTRRSPTPASGHSSSPLSQIGYSFAARPPCPPAAFSKDDSEHVAKINPSDMTEIKGKRRTSWVWVEFDLQIFVRQSLPQSIHFTGAVKAIYLTGAPPTFDAGAIALTSQKRCTQIVSSLLPPSSEVLANLNNAVMGLWTLFEGLLLLANALAILNEDRFLAPRGWSFAEFSVGQTKTLKGQVIGLIYAVQYMRVPLILLNGISIIVKLVSG